MGKAEDGLRKRFVQYYNGTAGGYHSADMIHDNRDDIIVQWVELDSREACRHFEKKWIEENDPEWNERSGWRGYYSNSISYLPYGSDEGGGAVATSTASGRHFEQDFSKAYELYEVAARAGLVRAICDLGYCWYYGRHQPKDYAKALYWFQLGVDLADDSNCLYKIGDMYMNGYAAAMST